METTIERKQMKAERRQTWLEAHYRRCEELVRLQGGNSTGERASAKLLALERSAHAAAISYCNGEKFHGLDLDLDFHENGIVAWDKLVVVVKNDLEKILGGIPTGFFVNGDARGHALKVEAGNPMPEGWPTDWGQDYILSPTMPEF